MRILILEDNQERIEWFKKVYKNHTLHIFEDIENALNCAKQVEVDIYFLDHDLLPDCNFNAISLGTTGYDFVKKLIENKLSKQAIFYIHSMNPSGANAMLNLLKDNNYEALWIPYHLLKLEDR
jgi:CheY-like chemotaxis protein